MRKSVINYTLVLLAILGAVAVFSPLQAQNPFTVIFGVTPWSANSGNKDAGTGRVVLATDQPALTNALKVDGSAVTQPVSGTVTANMGTVTADPFGANADAASATGSISAKLRFIAGTGIPITGTVAVTQSGAWSLSANQSVNVAQINGVTPLMGNGATGTGSHRVTTANDSSAIANWGHVATGAAPAVNATQAGFLTGDATAGGHTKQPIFCDNYKFDRSTTADVQLVAISGATTIYICGYRITGESATTSDVSLEYGTGSSCGTGTTGLTPPTTIGTGTSMLPGFVIPPGLWSGLKTTASQALCVHRSAAQSSEIEVWFTQF